MRPLQRTQTKPTDGQINCEMLPPRNGQCEGTTKTGKPCKAPVLKDKRYCAFHDNPKRASELGRTGGKGNRHYRPDTNDESIVPSTMAELRTFLAEAMVKLRAGRLEPKTATSLAYLAGPLLKLFENAELEERIRNLEEQVTHESSETD